MFRHSIEPHGLNQTIREKTQIELHDLNLVGRFRSSINFWSLPHNSVTHAHGGKSRTLNTWKDLVVMLRPNFEHRCCELLQAHSKAYIYNTIRSFCGTYWVDHPYKNALIKNQCSHGGGLHAHSKTGGLTHCALSSHISSDAFLINS